jgi:hypothetical protein
MLVYKSDDDPGDIYVFDRGFSAAHFHGAWRLVDYPVTIGDLNDENFRLIQDPAEAWGLAEVARMALSFGPVGSRSIH